MKISQVVNYKMKDLTFDIQNIAEHTKVTTYIRYGSTKTHEMNINLGDKKKFGNLSFNTQIKGSSAQGGQAPVYSVINLLHTQGSKKSFKNDHIIFMAEDYKLCTYEKHHKLKILLFLSSMRSHADYLKKNKFRVEYTKIDSSDFKKDYLEKVKKIINSKKIKEITSFEIEDKFFEKKLQNFVKKNDLVWNKIQSPMFLNSRQEFNEYLSKNKSPFMATFY